MYLLLTVFNLFNFVLCNTNNNFNNNLLYNYLINKKYNLAIKEINKIDKNYLFTKDLKEYLVKKMFINYKLNKLKLSDEILDRLLLLYKNDINYDYILYMKGLVNLKINKDIISKILYYNNFNINNEYMYKSLNYFNELISNYENSKYYKDSIYKIIYIKQILFIHNLSVIDFYFKNSNYISVINRSINLLNFFPENPYIYFPIKYIKKSCEILGLKDIEEKIDIIINNNLSNFKKLKIKF